MSMTRTSQARRREAVQLAAALTQAQTAVKQARTVTRCARRQQPATASAPSRPIRSSWRTGSTVDALDLGTELDQALIDLTALITHLWHAEQTGRTDGVR
jgi:hypothetical protein